MSQGKNMKQSYTGMRKGLSLMEMLISIVLFGLISTIGYIYYKNYYNTSYAAKQARVYVIVDQATQLSNAFDLYQIKYGEDANNTEELLNSMILSGLPTVPESISNLPWELNTTIIMTPGTSANDMAFTLEVNASTIADALDYCNILNNLAYKDWNTSSAWTDMNSSEELWRDGNKTAPGNNLEFFHCANHDGDTTADKNATFVFVVKTVI